MSGLFFDVATVLGIGDPDSSPAPPNESEGVILRVSQGLSVEALDGRGFLDPDTRDWYVRQKWFACEVDPGLWIVRIPIPNSERVAEAEVQRYFLQQGESSISPPLAIAALQCLERGCHPRPLQGENVLRCPSYDGRACIHWRKGKIFLGYLCGDEARRYIFSGGARRIS